MSKSGIAIVATMIVAGCANAGNVGRDQPNDTMLTNEAGRVQVDTPDSVECFKILADENHDAQKAENKGDYATALKIWRTSARRGNLFSKLSLCLVHNSSAIPDELRNMDEAYEQCVDLGKKGLAEAQYMLGRMYLSGRGVEKNITKAKSWFELAADGGNGDAQFILGYFYLTGESSTRDLVTAYKWINLAAQKNIKNSAKIRDDIEYLLTRQELSEAQKLTRNWSERKMSPWMPNEILAACPKS